MEELKSRTSQATINGNMWIKNRPEAYTFYIAVAGLKFLMFGSLFTDYVCLVSEGGGACAGFRC